MKKYIPAKMICQSRFITFFETWSEEEKEQLLERMSKLILDNLEYTLLLTPVITFMSGTSFTDNSLFR